MREVKVPDGWRPQFTKAFFGQTSLVGVVKVTGGDERWSESEAHFALAKLLEHRENVDAAVENVRAVIAEHAAAPDREAAEKLARLLQQGV